MPNYRRLGKAAENAAATYLQNKGFTIVTRGYKAKHGEIDIVAMEGDQLVFVEVKHRIAPGYRPEDSIGDAKRKALYLAGQQYLAEVAQEPDRDVRFDLIAIDWEGTRHYQDILAI